MNNLQSKNSNHNIIEKQAPPNSLLIAPALLREELGRLWAKHQHLFQSPLPLAAAIAGWCDDGLRYDDALDILRALQTPHNMAKFRFHADLMTSLAEMVSATLAARKREADQAAEREKHRREAAQALPAEMVREKLTGFAAGID